MHWGPPGGEPDLIKLSSHIQRRYALFPLAIVSKASAREWQRWTKGAPTEILAWQPCGARSENYRWTYCAVIMRVIISMYHDWRSRQCIRSIVSVLWLWWRDQKQWANSGVMLDVITFISPTKDPLIMMHFGNLQMTFLDKYPQTISRARFLSSSLHQ